MLVGSRFTGYHPRLVVRLLHTKVGNEVGMPMHRQVDYWRDLRTLAFLPYIYTEDDVWQKQHAAHP